MSSASACLIIWLQDMMAIANEVIPICAENIALVVGGLCLVRTFPLDVTLLNIKVIDPDCFEKFS